MPVARQIICRAFDGDVLLAPNINIATPNINIDALRASSEEASNEIKPKPVTNESGVNKNSMNKQGRSTYTCNFE